MLKAMPLLAALAIPAAGQIAYSPSRVVPKSHLCVDEVRLQSGLAVRGLILWQAADGSLTMAVSRQWLRHQRPDALSKLTAGEAATERRALEQLRDRIRTALQTAPAPAPAPTAPGESRLAVFLRMELKRTEELLAQPPSTDKRQFVWLDVTPKKVARAPAPARPRARVVRVPVERQRIAIWAWFEGLPDVETRDAADLARELERRKIDPAQRFPDLSDRFPLRLQDDREWAARLALVRYSLGEQLDFQGTGDLLVRSDPSAPKKDPGLLFAKLLEGQVETLLKDLPGPGQPAATKSQAGDRWLRPAIEEAERRNAPAFRATRVDFNLANRQTVVRSVFVVRIGRGNWEPIWSDSNTQDGTKARPDAEAAIADDPQLKGVLGAVKAFGGVGLGGAGSVTDDQLQQAIRFGAATMAAQQTVDNRFFAMQESLLNHLDGPPLWWPKEGRWTK